jgi:hypothetical protein
MSRFTELKASGTDRVGFPTPRSRGHGGYACGGEPQAKASGKSTAMDTLEKELQGTRRSDEEDKASAPPAATSLSPLAVVALSALGIIVGSAIVLHVSPWGSVGRYQLVQFGVRLVRIDTTTGDISGCYFRGFDDGRPATCFPWGQTNRDFERPKASGIAQ